MTPRFLIAPNDFKGSLDAVAAGRALAKGIQKVLPKARCECLPLSDGGPGLLLAVRASLGGRLRRSRVAGPLGQPVLARWLELPGKRAVVESAQAIGLMLVPAKRRDALRSDSQGLGQLLLALRRKGIREVWLGLGGSATTDGGMGMARALGWEFLDRHGRALAAGGASLVELVQLKRPVKPALQGMRLQVLCDVDSPLFGRHGAAFVYSPQKGASRAQVLRLDKGLRVLARHLPKSLSKRAGSGAAGGLGAGLQAFAGARLVAGAATLLRLTGFKERLQTCDWVISGEGRLDAQSLAGKLPIAISLYAQRARKPCWLVAGSVQGSQGRWQRVGATRVSVLQAPNRSQAWSIKHAAQLLKAHGREFAREYKTNMRGALFQLYSA